MCSRLPPNSLVVQAVPERARQQHPLSTPVYEEGKCQDLLQRKVFSSTFQFRIASYQALSDYDFLNTKFMEFTDSPLQQDRVRFQVLIGEGTLIGKSALQFAFNAAVTSCTAMATAIIMHREAQVSLGRSRIPSRISPSVNCSSSTKGWTSPSIP